jgi:hypothetical protein
MQTKHTAENTEASAVQVTRNHANRVKQKLNNPYISEDFKKIILRLETMDVVDALHVLRSATHLYSLKFKEIIQENA